jgi:5-methylcytosine-specific restriction endonuclease McrA
MSLDPAEKRAAWLRLKELAGEGRIVPEKRKKFTPKERAAVHEAYEGRCRACDRLVGLKFQVDHRVQLFRGGKHVPANWELLCIPCHAEKTGEEATGNAKIRRIEKRIVEGAEPSTLKSRNEWPKGTGFRRSESHKRTVDGRVVPR